MRHPWQRRLVAHRDSDVATPCRSRQAGAASSMVPIHAVRVAKARSCAARHSAAARARLGHGDLARLLPRRGCRSESCGRHRALCASCIARRCRGVRARYAGRPRTAELRPGREDRSRSQARCSGSDRRPRGRQLAGPTRRARTPARNERGECGRTGARHSTAPTPRPPADLASPHARGVARRRWRGPGSDHQSFRQTSSPWF